jgi:hypothetical protein
MELLIFTFLRFDEKWQKLQVIVLIITLTHSWNVRFEVLMVVKMMMLLFWVLTPCGLTGRY